MSPGEFYQFKQGLKVLPFNFIMTEIVIYDFEASLFNVPFISLYILLILSIY